MSSEAIPPQRLAVALHALAEAQAIPMNGRQMRCKVRDALMALDPDLALMPPLSALERLRENLTNETKL